MSMCQSVCAGVWEFPKCCSFSGFWFEYLFIYRTITKQEKSKENKHNGSETGRSVNITHLNATAAATDDETKYFVWIKKSKAILSLWIVNLRQNFALFCFCLSSQVNISSLTTNANIKFSISTWLYRWCIRMKIDD